MLLRLLLLSALFMLSACDNDPADVYQGYAEGEYVLVAAPEAGIWRLQVSLEPSRKGRQAKLRVVGAAPSWT